MKSLEIPTSDKQRFFSGIIINKSYEVRRITYRAKIAMYWLDRNKLSKETKAEYEAIMEEADKDFERMNHERFNKPSK